MLASPDSSPNQNPSNVVARAYIWSIVLRNPTIKILVRRVVKPSNHKPFN